MKKVLLLVAALLMLVSISSAQTLDLKVTGARYGFLPSPPPNRAQYSVEGTASGFGNNATVTIEIKDASNVTILTKTIPITNGNGYWSWFWYDEVAIANATYKVTLVDDPGKSALAPIVVTGPFLSPIPTLSEWAMIVFAVLLLGMMTYYFIRRRPAPQPIG